VYDIYGGFGLGYGVLKQSNYQTARLLKYRMTKIQANYLEEEKLLNGF